MRAIHEKVWAIDQDIDAQDYHDPPCTTADDNDYGKETDSDVENMALIESSLLSIKADSNLITWQGRTIPGSILASGNSSSRAFAWAGVQAMFNVEGASKISMTISAIFAPYEVKDVDPRFHVYVDGKCRHIVTAKLKHGKMARQRVSLLSGLAKNQSYQIIVYYLTDPRMITGKDLNSITAGAVTIHDFALDSGQFGAAPEQRQRRLLFIGDSQMAGYAVTTLNTNKSCAEGQDMSGGYGAIICERLGANCSYLTISGIGMYHNCCNNDLAMFDLFTLSLPGIKKVTYDFDNFAPDGVVVDVGENDENFVWPDTENASFRSRFIDEYVQFLGLLIKLHKNPNMKIFLVVDRTYHYADWIETAVKNFRKIHFGSNEILVLGFNAYDKDDACNHPTRKGQRQIAAGVQTRIAKALSWPWPSKPLGIKKLLC